MTMLTTSTHDTKRSEDVRARLAVLSEASDEWIATVSRWCDANDRYRDRDLDAPDRRDEWFIYQTLVGAHPLPLERAWPVIEKSLREAKRRTDWVRINEDYEVRNPSFRRIDPGRRRVPRRPRSLRRVDRRARADQLARTGRVAHAESRRPRHVSRHRAVGPEPRRPRQPPAGRLPRADDGAVGHRERQRRGVVGRPPRRRLAEAR